ncbi:MAG: hemolysin III family protein [Bacillota bacterium]
MKGARRTVPPNEIANAVTHGIGTGLSAAALVLLIVFASIYGNAWHIVSFSIYGATLVILYLCSTLYHSFQKERVKKFFRIMDHSAIFLLIAGTYTPFTLVTLRGPLGWTFFGVIWGLALVGILFKALFINRLVVLSTIFYILMGWLIIGSIKPLILNLPAWGLILLLAGGVFYTGGIFFYARTRNLFNHTVWHLFVLGGSICHFFSVLLYVLPRHG